MARILVVDDEPLLCDLFRGWLHDDLGADVECSMTATFAAQMVVSKHYNLALIDAVLPDASGIALAELAASQNTPVLLISGYSDVIDKLGRFGFPTLKKPFVSSRLLAEATSVMRHAGENILCVKASAGEMRLRTQALKAAIEGARRPADVVAEGAHV